MKYNFNSHGKYLLYYHIIFVYKYRHKMFDSADTTNYVKELSFKFCSRRNVEIKAVEVDRGNIHYFMY